MRTWLKLVLICIGLFAAAFITRRLFLADVVPIASVEETQAVWALEAAFLLRAIENIAAIGFAILMALGGLRWVRQRQWLRERARSRHPEVRALASLEERRAEAAQHGGGEAGAVHPSRRAEGYEQVRSP